MGDPRILGVMQGYAFQKRKGSAFYHLFDQIQKKDMLSDIVDVELPSTMRKLFFLRNLALNKQRWNAKDQLDTWRYKVLSLEAVRKVRESQAQFNSIIQVGSMVNLARFTRQTEVPCFSFHDNNAYGFIGSLSDSAKPTRRASSAINYENAVYKDLTGVFTMSKRLAASFIRDFGLPEEKVHYVGFGTPFEGEDISNKDYSRRSILMVASHSFEQKGGETVLAAFRKVRKQFGDAELVIVGRDWGIEEEGVRNIGFLDKRYGQVLERYKDLFRSASLFVMPSYNEAFGEVFIEAMSYGVPCIGANNGVMPEIICDNECGSVIESGDSEELSKLMLSLLSDPQTLKKLGQNGIAAVNNEYTWKNVIGRVDAVIRKHV